MDDGETAVTAAYSRGHHRIVKILIESGADVSEKDLLGGFEDGIL